jgi:SAM-dependent methyltransferase
VDWVDRLPVAIGQVCDELSIRVRYVSTPKVSSTALLKRFQPDVDAFEQLVLSQQPADKPWEPTAAVPYDFESRKIAEGKHPELIRDVFQPRTVLDAGCGPGYLVSVLRGALNVDATGFDVNPPDGEHFYQQDLCAESHPVFWDLPYTAWDLVVNRECLEHLTILQIRRAVANLCTLSSRFVYLTTRFAQARHFLDFATSDDLDPTHISILPMDWLRHLFVLEGFKRRADLEQRMDWQHKGRVLVYERAA